MPVKRDYQVDPQWFISHTPFDLNGGTLVENINDMVSYDVKPLDTEQLKVIYEIGKVEQGQLFRIVVRNLTQNASLQIKAVYNKSLVKILSDDDMLIEQNSILLNRGETKSARLFLNTDVFNSYSASTKIETTIQLLISHVANGDVIKRDDQMIPLEQKSTVDSLIVR